MQKSTDIHKVLEGLISEEVQCVWVGFSDNSPPTEAIIRVVVSYVISQNTTKYAVDLMYEYSGGKMMSIDLLSLYRDGEDIQQNNLVTYEDITFQKFVEKLNRIAKEHLGIDVIKQVSERKF